MKSCPPREAWDHIELCEKCNTRMDPAPLGSFDTRDLYDPWPFWFCNRCGNVVRKQMEESR